MKKYRLSINIDPYGTNTRRWQPVSSHKYKHKIKNSKTMITNTFNRWKTNLPAQIQSYACRHIIIITRKNKY